MSLEIPFKKNKFFIPSFIFFTLIHPFAVFMTSALLAGWHDAEPIGGILGLVLIFLMPLILLGKKVAFLGVGVYAVSALLWGLFMSSISTLLYNLYRNNKQKQ